MDIEFNCVQCGQLLSADTSAGGQEVQCPTCGKTVTVPTRAEPIPQSQTKDDMIFCPQCGQQNQENNFKCTSCGFVLHGPAQPQYVVSDESTMGGLIPYKNAEALWAYYLGVFSLIPCIGIPLGITAIVMGFKGLSYAEKHPHAKGKVHAWIGIILGGLCAIGYTLLIVIPLMMAAFS